ncbi:MAG: hypothetical protein IT293_08990 [Deltaproteobacteria bacterium]|nr:hypothetical protein [Deltaproteobacteria bacterium]
MAAYDAVATDAVCRQLLLNVARARHNEPLHFTALSNIAATYSLQLNAGATPPLGGLEGGAGNLSPIFGGSWTDNPTLSIVPVEGEEFTRRLLTPFPESTLTLLLRQGADVDLVLRMMAGEYRTELDGARVTYANKPSDREGYTVFRRVAVHVSSIQDRGALYAEPMIFTDTWTVPAESVTPEVLQSFGSEYTLTRERGGNTYRVTKRTIGRIVITNYDPEVLSNDERRRLHEEASHNLDDELVVDVRSGYPGGEFPLHGKFRLRSFANMIDFLGRALGEDPEYAVAPHSHTPAVRENPAFTLEMVESSRPVRGERAIRYRGHYYALAPESGYPWNKKAFVLLYQLFQMTVVKPASAAPSITIAK